MASIFKQLNPLKPSNQKSEAAEVSLLVQSRLHRVGQMLVAKRASVSSVILLLLAAWLWLSYEPTPESNPSVQYALPLPSKEQSTLAVASPLTATSVEKTPEHNKPKPAQPSKDNHQLSNANQKAIELALAGQASQATSTLEQALLNDPQAGVVFDNLRRLYAGFASQSYQLAIEPNKPKPVTVELTSADQPIAVQLAAAQPIIPNKPSSTFETTQATETSRPPLVSQAPQLPSITETPKEPAATMEAKPITIATPVPAQKVTEPTPAQKEATQRKAQQQAIHQALKHWSDAWSKQDVKGYFASYAPNYTPKNSTRKAWMDYRQERILAPKRIKVELSDVKIVLLKANLAKVSFSQNYTSDTLSSRNQKTLELELINNAWLITSESGR